VTTVRELGHELVAQSPMGLARLQAAFQKASGDANYLRTMNDFDLAFWQVEGAVFRQYATSQFARGKVVLDEIGFKPE